jgi:photosystem II stability/assembly factor-like uncharacterized protein
MSPTQKGTLYIGAQYLFRSHDHGQTWDRISPDLTTNDPQKQKQEQSGGVTIDNSAAETHTTIYAICESPKNPAVIWVGTDDGNLQVTKDGGRTWTNVVHNVPGLPKDAWVSYIDAGHFDAGTAYATFDMHTSGDLKPYVYRTTDYGKSWKPLVAKGSPMRGYAHVVKEDPSRRTCCSSAPSSGCGCRSMAADTGRSTRAASCRRSPCAISRSTSATTIWRSRRTAGACGSWTTSRRCGR